METPDLIPPPPGSEWIGTPAAARMLGVHRSTLASLADQGLLTRRQVGRGHAKYLASEVAELARRSIRVRQTA